MRASHTPPSARFRAPSRRAGRWQALLLAGSLGAALVAQGVLARSARACGPEIDYGPEKVVTQVHRGRTEARLNFRRHDMHFKGGNLNLSEVRVFTRDKGFAAWLSQHGMTPALWKHVKPLGQRTHCSTLFDGRQILRLERQLATAVRKAYTRATRRSTPRFDVMLVSGVLDGSDVQCR